MEFASILLNKFPVDIVAKIVEPIQREKKAANMIQRVVRERQRDLRLQRYTSEAFLSRIGGQSREYRYWLRRWGWYDRSAGDWLYELRRFLNM